MGKVLGKEDHPGIRLDLSHSCLLQPLKAILSEDQEGLLLVMHLFSQVCHQLVPSVHMEHLAQLQLQVYHLKVPLHYLPQLPRVQSLHLQPKQLPRVHWRLCSLEDAQEFQVLPSQLLQYLQGQLCNKPLQEVSNHRSLQPRALGLRKFLVQLKLLVVRTKRRC